MAKHKAPTEVTIASTTEESDLHRMVKAYWPVAAGLALVCSAVILFLQWRGQQENAGAMDSWTRLGNDVSLLRGTPPPAAGVLAEVAEELADTPAGPWAKAIEVGKHIADENPEGARRALAELTSQWPDHILASVALYPRPGGDEAGPPRRLADHVDSQLAALEAWEKAHPHLFANPPLPEDAPRVRIHTSLGPIVVGLYADLAPEHAANFVKLAQEGYYDGQRFHQVVQGSKIQAGDPNSKDESNPDSWGQGDPGYTLDPEVGSLWHFPGALAAAAPLPGGPSNGSQFYIVTGEDQHTLDGNYTVFGAILEGQEVVDQIEAGAVLGDRPQDPVTITSTEVL